MGCSVCAVVLLTFVTSFLLFSQKRAMVYAGPTLDLSEDWTRPFITDIKIVSNIEALEADCPEGWREIFTRTW